MAVMYEPPFLFQKRGIAVSLPPFSPDSDGFTVKQNREQFYACPLAASCLMFISEKIKLAYAKKCFNNIKDLKSCCVLLLLSSRMIEIQTQMSERAVELLSLPEGQPCFLLDVG